MVGTAPVFMALTYACASPASRGPLSSCVPSRLGCARAKMAAVSLDTPCGVGERRRGEGEKGREGGIGA